MGIARFYRWLSERYPLMNEVIDVDNVPEFDNFYLDMNGIIHHCSHGNTGGRKQASEDHMWLDVFKYVSGLVYRIKPKKLLYLAVDGVAPRAKMNQQRSRRFRSAHDAKESRDKSDKMNHSNGLDPDSAAGFDSNCITPGTAFMERLVFHLEFFVQKKIAEDPLWKDLKIVLSGPDVPGEGEHKIMDYIRSIKSQPSFDPNTRHCLYGLDADLIMLSLASHEPYFALLREEIDFSFSRTKSKENRSMVKPDKFQLLHIAVLREYLALDFLGDFYLENRAQASSLVERVIDDFVLFCFLVGNDFLPHLPFAEIGEGGLNKLFDCYKKLMKSKGENGHFLAKLNGDIDYANLFLFLQNYLPVEQGLIEEMLNHQRWKIGETRVCNSETPPLVLPSSELYNEDAVDLLSASDEEWKVAVPIVKKQSRRVSRGTPDSVEEAMIEYYDIKLGIGANPADDTKPDLEKLVFSYLEALQWIYLYYYKGPPSWDWYYPYHYSPFAVDIVQVLSEKYSQGSDFSISFELGKPFLPFQQLMAVLPPASGKNLLPTCLYNLMVAPRSPIREFYPEEFQIDIDGVRVPWGGVTIIPFVDERKLVAVINQTIRDVGLSANDAKRNSLGTAKIFSAHTSKASSTSASLEVVTSVVSSIPSLLKDVNNCKIAVEDFDHLPLPAGVSIFPHYLLPGYSPSKHSDFPSLFKHSEKFALSYSFGNGVRIFNSASKQESVFVTLTVDPSRQLELSALNGTSLVSSNFPFYSKRCSLVSYSDGERKVGWTKGKQVNEAANRSKHESDVDWLVSKLEESGLCIEFSSGDSDGEISTEDARAYYSQPILEVTDEASNGTGEPVKVLGTLAVLAQPKRVRTTATGLKSAAAEHAIQLCMDVKNPELFGYPYELVGGKGKFAHVLSSDSAACIQAAIGDIAKLAQSPKYTLWQSAPEIASSLGVSPNLVWSLFGEVWIRFGKFQEEIGMNLWTFASTGEPQCVPNYSRFTPSRNRRTGPGGKFIWNRWEQPDRKEWKFSSEAVKALREYMRDCPELIAEVTEAVAGASVGAINGGMTVQGRNLFKRFKRPDKVKIATSRDDWISEYYLGKIVGYVNGRRWKTLAICSWEYAALPSDFVTVMSSFMDKFSTNLVTHEVVAESDALCPLSRDTLASSLKAAPALSVGARGIYVKENGVVPVGAWGTVIGFYGSSHDLRIDVLLDHESLNASSLTGACPEMRGIRITRAEWRTAAPRASVEITDSQLKSVKNKILADLIVQYDAAMKAAGMPAPAPKGSNESRPGNPTRQRQAPPAPAPPAPVKASPPVGVKISVSDLFGKAKAAAAQVAPPKPAQTQQRPTQPASRRPLPPTALFSLPKELTGAVPSTTTPQQLPDFLLSKLRQSPPSNQQ